MWRRRLMWEGGSSFKALLPIAVMSSSHDAALCFHTRPFCNDHKNTSCHDEDCSAEIVLLPEQRFPGGTIPIDTRLYATPSSVALNESHF
ncbi:hypothetical protein MHYP_G00058930 [Metynnis hypsauchen]